MNYLLPHGRLLWAQRQSPLDRRSTVSTRQSTTPDMGNNLISMVLSQGTPRKNKQNPTNHKQTNQATLIHPTAASQNKRGKLAVPTLESLDPSGLSALHSPALWKCSAVETKSFHIDS